MGCFFLIITKIFFGFLQRFGLWDAVSNQIVNFSMVSLGQKNSGLYYSLIDERFVTGVYSGQAIFYLGYTELEAE